MMKKFVVVLSICVLCFTSIGRDSYAKEIYNRNLIEGNTRQISMELNKSVFKEAKEAIIINEESLIDGISATPLAYAKNAPIIPIKGNDIDKNTQTYLEELGVEKVTIIGGFMSVSATTQKNLKKLGYEVTRIYGDDRYETSIKIADEINEIKTVNNIIIINASSGLENALAIYSYAGKNNIPIIWSNGQDFKMVKTYIKNNKVKKIFTIGDSEDFHYKVNENIKNAEIIKEINVAETNINLIQNAQKTKFKEIYAINVEFGSRSDSNEYISLGVVAAKKDIPILICNESLTKPQESFLEKNDITTLDQVGSEIKDYSIFNVLMTKSFLSSVVLILLLIIMLIRAFIHKG